MKFILIAVGSAGDVFPLVSIGAHLRARGHEVTLVAAPVFSEIADLNRLAFIPTADDTSHAASMTQKYLMMTRYAGLYHLRYAVSWNCAAFQAICQASSSGRIIVTVDRPNVWADLFARARLGIPVLRIQLDLPYIATTTANGDYLPMSRVQLSLSGRLEAQWKNSMRARGFDTGNLQVSRLQRSVGRSVSTIALWPRWALGNCGDAYRLPTFGFMPQPACVAKEQPDFAGVESGKKIVFVAGTAGTIRDWSKQFVDASLRICATLGYVGVFLGIDQQYETVAIPYPHIRSAGVVSLSTVLKSASAIVHHGGIGTAAAAILQGVPQLVIPRCFAQPHNAEWLRQLGLCSVLSPKDYYGQEGFRAVVDILTKDSYRSAAELYAQQTSPCADLQKVCEYLERSEITTQVRTISRHRNNLRRI